MHYCIYLPDAIKYGLKNHSMSRTKPDGGYPEARSGEPNIKHYNFDKPAAKETTMEQTT
jgi:hypothetical protein